MLRPGRHADNPKRAEAPSHLSTDSGVHWPWTQPALAKQTDRHSLDGTLPVHLTTQPC